MKTLKKFLLFGLSATLVFAVFGCGSDDDDSGTNPTTQQMTNEQAAAQFASSLSGGGLEIVLGAISSARSDWDGYQPPDIDGTIGDGFGKITTPNDTIWGDTTVTGWIVYYADADFSSSSGDTVTTAEFVVSDSVMLQLNGVPTPITTEPDYLDLRTHGDFDISYSDGESSLTMTLDFYQKVVFDRLSSTSVGATLDDVFTLGMVGDVPTTQSIVGADETINIQYRYEVTVHNMVFSAVDDYMCPVSGTITCSVNVTANDGTNSMSGSATATLTIGTGGTVTGTILSGTYTQNFSYSGFCAEYDGAPMNPLEMLLDK